MGAEGREGTCKGEMMMRREGKCGVMKDEGNVMENEEEKEEGAERGGSYLPVQVFLSSLRE